MMMNLRTVVQTIPSYTRTRLPASAWSRILDQAINQSNF